MLHSIFDNGGNLENQKITLSTVEKTMIEKGTDEKSVMVRRWN